MQAGRVIGARKTRPQGIPSAPTGEERQWVRHMAKHLTRVPKGVFRYRTMEEANADWERWQAELITAEVTIDG